MGGELYCFSQFKIIKPLQRYKDSGVRSLCRKAQFKIFRHKSCGAGFECSFLTIDFGFPAVLFQLYYDNVYFKATIMMGPTSFYSYEADINDKITLDTFYPAIMIYEVGGYI